VCPLSIVAISSDLEPFKFWYVRTISLERLIVSGTVNLFGRSVW